MEIDLLKSESQDQMDMIMMMQMGKLSDLCGPNNDTPAMDFSDGSNSGKGGSTSPEFISNHLASPSFINQPSSISFWPGGGGGSESQEQAKWRGASEFGGANTSQSEKRSSVVAMREMIFRIAAMQPIHIDPETVKPPKRRNVKISTDPQSVAARHRRERISERIRILQRLVPGGTKMDTASMLDEAIHYVKFLKTQVQSLELAAANLPAGIGFPVAMSDGSFLPLGKANCQPDQNLFQQYYDA